nr:MAG TPA: hypothetical protein [Caudoviricetes sp.]
MSYNEEKRVVNTIFAGSNPVTPITKLSVYSLYREFFVAFS